MKFGKGNYSKDQKTELKSNTRKYLSDYYNSRKSKIVRIGCLWAQTSDDVKRKLAQYYLTNASFG